MRRTYRQAVEKWASEDRSNLPEDIGLWDQSTRSLYFEAGSPPLAHTSREPIPSQLQRWNTAASAKWNDWLDAGVRERLTDYTDDVIVELAKEIGAVTGTMQKEINTLCAEVEQLQVILKHDTKAKVTALPNWRTRKHDAA
jgi:hypothetical protein